MKLYLTAVLLLFCFRTSAQVIVQPSDPIGPGCSSGLHYNTQTGALWGCRNSAWALVTSSSGGATIPKTTNLISGSGTGNGADSGLSPLSVGNSVANTGLYQQVLNYKPSLPTTTSPLATIGLIAQYDLTGLTGGTTSVPSIITTGSPPALQINGAPTLGAGGITLAGGTQWINSAFSYATDLRTPWTVMIVADQQVAASAGTAIASFADTAVGHPTNGVTYYNNGQNGSTNSINYLYAPGDSPFVQANSGTSCASTTASTSCSFSSTPTVGDRVIVGVSNGGLTGAVTCTDNQTPANTYTQVVIENSTPASAETAIFSSPVTTASGTFTVTCSVAGSGSNFLTIGIAEYDSTLSLSTPATSTLSTTGTSVSQTTTTTAAGSIIISVLSANGAMTTITSNTTGFPMRASQQNGSTFQPIAMTDSYSFSPNSYLHKITANASSGVISFSTAAFSTTTRPGALLPSVDSPGGTYDMILMSYDGANVNKTRGDTGGYVQSKSTFVNAAAFPSLGIGADVRSSVTAKTDGLRVAYVLLWNRILSPLEVANTWGWVSSYLTGKTSPISAFKRPPLNWYSMPDNGLMRTPYMGWGSFYAYGEDNLNETVVKANADQMVANGMTAAGYTVVEVDGGWPANYRDSFGNLVANPTIFPSGIPSLASHIHANGQLFGLYTSWGAQECLTAAEKALLRFPPASYAYEFQDMRQFAAWNVDHVFVDSCDATPYAENLSFWDSTSATGQIAQSIYDLYAAGIGLSGRAMRLTVFPESFIVNQGLAQGSIVPQMALTGANSWIAWPDIGPGWSGVDGRFDYLASTPASYVTPGHYNDLDSLMAGGALTHDEGKSQFSLWALVAAPLFPSRDLTGGAIDATDLATLLNTDVIAVDQDPLVKAGVRVQHTACGSSFCDVFARQLTGTNTCAIGLFNRDSAPHDISITWATVAATVSACGTGPYTTTRDLWAHSSLGTLTSGYTATGVPAHGVAMIKVAP